MIFEIFLFLHRCNNILVFKTMLTLKEFIERKSQEKAIELQKVNSLQGSEQEKLQVLNHRGEILTAINGNIVTIISAVTGSGKVRKQELILSPINRNKLN